MLAHASTSSAKKCADAVLAYASACQRIQRCGDAVLVYAARMPVHPAQRGRSPGVCSAYQYVQCLKKKKLEKCANSRAGVARRVAGIWTYAGAYPVLPAPTQPPLGIARTRVAQPRHAHGMVARLWRERSNPARTAGTSRSLLPPPLLLRIRSNLVGTTRTSRLHFTLSLSRLQSHLRFTIPCYGRARSNPARSAGTSHPSFMATNCRFAGTREATQHAWPELRTCRALRPFSRVLEATW